MKKIIIIQNKEKKTTSIRIITVKNIDVVGSCLFITCKNGRFYIINSIYNKVIIQDYKQGYKQEHIKMALECNYLD